VIPAGRQISLNAAYMLILRDLTRFSRNPRHVPKRVRVPLFAQLDDSQRACFLTGSEIRLKAGETLIYEGDPADFFYVMLEGEARATKFYGDQEIFMAEVVPGKFFGEVEILLDIPDSWLGRVVADSRLFRLPRAGFWELLRTSPTVAREIMRTLATRLRNLEGLHTGAREAHPTWRDGGRACP
jgi:CRP-like cAMP-binding protein